MVGKALWQNLKILVDFDRQILDLNKDIDLAKKAISDFALQASNLEKIFGDKKALQLQLKKQINLLELQIKSLDDSIEQKNVALDNVKNQQESRSLEHEIDFIVREKMKLNNQVAEHWYQFENINSSIELDESKGIGKLDNLKKDIKIRQDMVDSNFAKKSDLLQQRQHIATCIPSEWLMKYERMRHSVEDPIVPIINDCCSACYYAVLRQDITKIKQAGILPCRNCYRFLYLDNGEQIELQQAKF